MNRIKNLVLFLIFCLFPFNIVKAATCSASLQEAKRNLTEAESLLPSMESCYGYEVKDNQVVKKEGQTSNLGLDCYTTLGTFYGKIQKAYQEMLNNVDNCKSDAGKEIMNEYLKTYNAYLKLTNIVQNAFGNSVGNNTKPTVDTTIGQIKVITCGGNAENKIPARIPHFIRGLYNTLKILIPIIIIGLGMFDFVKAVIASKESEMDDKKSKFIRRLLAGIMIFFIMAIVQWIFGLFNDKENLMGCLSCFLSDESACIDAGYVSPGKLDEENNKAPTKQPSGNTNNSVVTQDKEDTSISTNTGSSTTNTGSSSNTTTATDNQNTDTQNSNTQNSTNSYDSDSNVSDGSDCKTYSKENCVSSKHSYCTYNTVSNKCERNRNWWCALYGANNCPVGKKDSRGSLCQITTTQSGTKVCSGIGVKKCSDYAAFNCPTSVEGKKCKVYTQVKAMAGVQKKVQVCDEAAS